MDYTLTHFENGDEHIRVLVDDVPYEADSNHPWWDEIVDLVMNNERRVLDLFPFRCAQTKVDLDAVFDGDPISDEELDSAKEAYERVIAKAADVFGGPSEDDENDPYFSSCGDPDCPECYGSPYVETPYNDFKCDDPDCGMCYPPDYAPDVQVRREVEANRKVQGMLEDSRDDADTKIEIQESIIRDQSEEIDVLIAQLEDAEKITDYEVERSDFLESALRHYADHAYAEIKQKLEEKWPR